MAKDPAFLFYSSDFLTGVTGLTMEERGQYITLLCLQHQQGHLSGKTCRLALGLESLDEAPDVMSKFIQDENGLYYNARLDSEIIKRAKSADASRENGTKGGRPKKPNSEPKQNLQVSNRLTQTKPKNNLPENENEYETVNEYENNNNLMENVETNARTRVTREGKAPKVQFAEFVSMTNDERSSLVAKLGEHGTARCVEILDNYKGANGKKYKSDYRAILNWVVGRYEEEQPKSGAPKGVRPIPKSTFAEIAEKLDAEENEYCEVIVIDP